MGLTLREKNSPSPMGRKAEGTELGSQSWQPPLLCTSVHSFASQHCAPTPVG